MCLCVKEGETLFMLEGFNLGCFLSEEDMIGYQGKLTTVSSSQWQINKYKECLCVRVWVCVCKLMQQPG